MIVVGGLDNLTSEELVIVQEHLFLGKKQIKKIRLARRDRLDIISGILWNELSRAENHQVMNALADDALAEKFIEDNQQSLAISGVEGILDYFQGTAGTSYDGVGLIDSSYIPSTYTLQQLVDILSNVIQGDYSDLS